MSFDSKFLKTIAAGPKCKAGVLLMLSDKRLPKSRILLALVGSLLCFVSVKSAIAQGAAPWVGETLKGGPCPSRGQGYGPFDYLNRSALSQQLYLVESAHFTPAVENLVKGNTGTLVGDLAYTLMAWPNHHRALNSMMREQARREASYLRSGNIPPMECYFQRAINYSSRDSMLFMLFGMFLHKTGHTEPALSQYEKGESISPDNLQLLYNKGLLLVDMGKFDQAEAIAEKVYAQDFPLPGLKKRLSRATRN